MLYAGNDLERAHAISRTPLGFGLGSDGHSAAGAGLTAMAAYHGARMKIDGRAEELARGTLHGIDHHQMLFQRKDD